jgi:hypothetical protein
MRWRTDSASSTRGAEVGEAGLQPQTVAAANETASNARHASEFTAAKSRFVMRHPCRLVIGSNGRFLGAAARGALSRNSAVRVKLGLKVDRQARPCKRAGHAIRACRNTQYVADGASQVGRAE